MIAIIAALLAYILGIVFYARVCRDHKVSLAASFIVVTLWPLIIVISIPVTIVKVITSCLR